MVRAPYIDKNGVKKGAWSKEEDDKLSAYIKRYGHWNWRELPKFAGLQRCGKSCRLRWVNYLKPNVKRGNYTTEEDDLIIKLHDELGNKWSKIAEKLPGRSDNEIKNHWHTILKKCYRRRGNQNNPEKEWIGTISSESESDNKKQESMEVETSESISRNVNVESGKTKSAPACTASFDDHQQTSTESPSGSVFSLSMILNSGDFWSEPFQVDFGTFTDSPPSAFDLDSSSMILSSGDFWSEPFQVNLGTFTDSPPSAFEDLDYNFFSPVDFGTFTDSPPSAFDLDSLSMILNSGDFWSEPFQVNLGTFTDSPPSAFDDLDYHFFSPVASALDDEYLWLK